MTDTAEDTELTAEDIRALIDAARHRLAAAHREARRDDPDEWGDPVHPVTVELTGGDGPISQLLRQVRAYNQAMHTLAPALADRRCTPTTLLTLQFLAWSTDEEARPTDIAEHLGISKSGISRVLEIAARRGWVTRIAARDSHGKVADARGVLVTLTTAGATMLTEAGRIAADALTGATRGV